MNNRLNRQFSSLNKEVFSIIFLGLSLALTLGTVCNAEKPAQPKKNLTRLPATQKVETVSTETKPTARLEDWRFVPKASQLEMTLSAASKPHYFYLPQPSRIVVDLPATKLGSVPTRQNYSGTIQSIRVSQLKTGVTRIVMDVAPGTFVDPKQVKLQPISLNNPTHWVLRPFRTSYRTPLPSTKYPSKANYLLPTTSATQLPNNQSSTTGSYNPPQPPNNQPSRTGSYNPPQPPTDQSLSKDSYNAQQSASFNVPPPITNLPPSYSNVQQMPTVSVPPLSPRNSAQLPNNPVLPPANFPTQPTNLGNVNTTSTPEFPVPTISNSQ
uniref:AMIN domain-containing protein n=1 Tax=Aetokthonos hydrillicola TaxID=1550245 RepID=UPI001ABAB768